MNIKYYKLKQNGMVGKTPQYYKSFDKNFCRNIIDCIWGEASLFDMYKSLSTLDINYFGDIFVDNNLFPAERFQEVVKDHLERYIERCLEKKKEDIRLSIKLMEDQYKEKLYNSIDFLCFGKEDFIKKYRTLKSDLEHLNKQIIVVEELRDSGHTDDYVYRYILDDIKPLDEHEINFK